MSQASYTVSSVHTCKKMPIPCVRSRDKAKGVLNVKANKQNQFFFFYYGYTSIQFSIVKELFHRQQ